MRALVLIAVILAFAFAVALPAAYGQVSIQPSSSTQPGVSLPLPPSEQIMQPPLVRAPYIPVPCPVFPSEPPSDYVEPPAVAPIPEQPSNFINFSAQDIRTTFDEEGRPALTTATGNVTACYKDVVITSERATADYKTNIATFEGNVVFRIGIEEVRGTRITLNMRTREWAFFSAGTTITPQFARGYLSAPVFAKARKIEGLGRRWIKGYDAEVTTCDLPDPHYDFTAREFDVYPDSKIIFRNLTLTALGHRLMTLPRLVMPINQIRRNPNLLPSIGQSAEEGVFAKWSYAYTASQAATGVLLLNVMQRKGVQTGTRYTYQHPNIAGNIELYQLSDQTTHENNFEGRIDHRQNLGTIQLGLTSNLRYNSFVYAPNSQSINSTLSLVRDRPGAYTSLAIGENMNNTFIRTTQLTSTLRHTQRFSQDSVLDSNFDYLSFDTSGSSEARLTSDVSYTKTEDKFDWSVSAQKLTDLTDEAFAGRGRFAGIERLPEVAIATDTCRIGKFLPFGMPVNMKFSFGQFNELPNNTDLGRALFQLNTPIQRYCLTSKWALAAGAGFRQFFYSDNTAQYAVDASADLRRQIGQSSNFALTYRYLQPRGFTPFRFDFIGRYNTLNASLNLRETEKLRLSLLSGYNFEQPQFPWQDVVIRLGIQPSRNFMFYTATGYDINQAQWRTLINQIRFRGDNNFRLDIGTRYDTIRNKFSSVRTDLETPIGSKTSIRALVGFNGFTNSLDYTNVMITRDLHCWEASLTFINQGGFYTNRSIMLNFRIKAFPLFRDFGVGPFGQALDTSVGQVY